jgi:hypothetical protein
MIIYGTKLPIKLCSAIREIDLKVTGTQAHEALLQNARARNSHILQHPDSLDAKIDYMQFQDPAHHPYHNKTGQLDLDCLSRT